MESNFQIGDEVARRTKTFEFGKVVEMGDRGIRVMWDVCGSRKNVRTWIQSHALIKKP